MCGGIFGLLGWLAEDSSIKWTKFLTQSPGRQIFLTYLIPKSFEVISLQMRERYKEVKLEIFEHCRSTGFVISEKVHGFLPLLAFIVIKEAITPL